ncbi:hypothetical protein [Amycolatopsis sp. WQ 127309]|uniref:hypothetical protein n=1 Tax=Amycolatopsis sp. WQ 127309 TaxID=2932773 RepID=UPI001FF37C21|nr:hypothetical protein [Amycolatopsis sp. WQ 127309]UOZ05549.1 hypothetical protein MUY22_43095 [Amycolatopsis sp. WQ 127309]
MNARDRAVALLDILELRKSVSDAVRELSRFGFDGEEDLVTLTPAHVIGLLREYLSGALTEKDVEVWAEALAGRDDVGLLEGYENLLKQVLFELSTPEINEPIDFEMARRWAERISTLP